MYGFPCDVLAFETLSRKYGIPVIYDAAHAFGVEVNGQSVLNYGDASILSLHATKVLHSVEGGVVVANQEDVAEKVEWMRRYGHNGFGDFHGTAINAKLSELHAAMGIANLRTFNRNTSVRMQLTEWYDSAFSQTESAAPVPCPPAVNRNYAYYPVLFRDEPSLETFMMRLQDFDIHARRYFWPCLTQIPSHKLDGNVPIAESVSKRILCLPLASSWNEDELSQLKHGVSAALDSISTPVRHAA